MGGCCCCSSKGTELNPAPAYYYCPRASEEHVPLSSGHGGASALSTGLLVDTNLATSIPDTYRPPPAPMPYDIILGRPQTPPVAQEICNSKMDAAVQTTNAESFQQTVDGNALENSAKSEDPKESECKVQIDCELDSAKGSEVELSKPVKPVIFASEEEDCPICLEEFDAENPKITTKCEHHFHLACILEWMERSDACPVCDKVCPNDEVLRLGERYIYCYIRVSGICFSYHAGDDFQSSYSLAAIRQSRSQVPTSLLFKTWSKRRLQIC